MTLAASMHTHASSSLRNSTDVDTAPSSGRCMCSTSITMCRCVRLTSLCWHAPKSLWTNPAFACALFHKLLPP